MSDEQIKGYVKLAEEELAKKKEDLVQKVVKEIVQETLEKIEELDKKIDTLQEEKKILKQTIDDLKNGSLKLIKERLEKDKKAADFIPFKVVEINRPIIINYPLQSPWRHSYDIWYGNAQVTCSGSSVSNAVQGTYCLNDKTVTIR